VGQNKTPGTGSKTTTDKKRKSSVSFADRDLGSPVTVHTKEDDQSVQEIVNELDMPKSLTRGGPKASTKPKLSAYQATQDFTKLSEMNLGTSLENSTKFKPGFSKPMSDKQFLAQ